MPPQPRAPRTAPRRSARAPGPRAVVWGSLTLFAVLFTLLTFQLSASAAPGGGSGHRPVATRAETEAPETEALRKKLPKSKSRKKARNSKPRKSKR